MAADAPAASAPSVAAALSAHAVSPSLQFAAGDSRPPSRMSSSQQRRQDGLGTKITGRSTSSAGNSLSSRSAIEGISPACEIMSPESSRYVRTMPTWVQRREDDEEEGIQIPASIHRRPPERSIHDRQRDNTPVTPSSPNFHGCRWKNFVDSASAYPPNTSHSEKDGPDWLAEQPDLTRPWLYNHQNLENEGDGTADDQDVFFFLSKKKGRIWYKRIHIILLNSPMVPLTFRSIIWFLSLLALALSSSIFHLSNVYGFAQKPSTVMAIVVDAIALVYLIYITYDEYSGKPLGLRSPTTKIRLLMFDLVFIVFDSANLSLAFDTLYDIRWSCRSAATAADFRQKHIYLNRTVEPICDRQKALAAFLFLALFAWVGTFMISVFRVVERVSSR